MTFWQRTYPTARKVHTCAMCGRDIRQGETYRRSVGMDGTAWTWKECAHCTALVGHICDLWELDEYSPDLFHEWEPETLAELRIAVHARKRWMRADGTLFPVPHFAPVRPDGKVEALLP